jgi:hypothetical protein
MADAKENEEEYKPKSQDEIRQSVTEELDLDPEKDKERIEKLVAREEAHQKELSTAIRQKQDHRKTASEHEKWLADNGYDPKTREKLKRDEEGKGDDSKKPDPEKEEMRNRLDSVEMEQAGEFSEDVQKELRDYSKLKGITLKAAAKSPYIQHLVTEEKRRADNEDAAIGGGKGGKKVSDKKLSDIEPEDITNLSDEDFDKFGKKLRGGK